MKISISLLAILAVMTFFVSCSNNNDCNCPEDIYGKWSVEEFMSVESIAYPKDNDYSPTIAFKNDGTFGVELDVNHCFGSFEMDDDKGIAISDSGCTEVCCDSEFSLKFITLLPEVTSYEIEDDVLKFSIPGWGWIELKRVSD